MNRDRQHESVPAMRARIAKKIEAASGNEMLAARLVGVTDVDEAERILRDAIAPVLKEIDLVRESYERGDVG